MTSEEKRHRSEVRWCITKGRKWFDGYKAEVAKCRGPEAARRLIADVNAQVKAGNTGAPGDWRETDLSAARSPGACPPG